MRFFYFLICLVFIFPEVSSAQVIADNATNDIISVYRAASAQWVPTLMGYARRVFFILVLIDLIWTYIQLALRDEGLQGFIAETTRRVLFIGFYLILMENGYNWTSIIVDSFSQAAETATLAAGDTPMYSSSNIFDIGLSLMGRILRHVSLLSPIDSLVMLAAGLIVLILFALIAALLIITAIEMWVVLSAGTLVLGLSGSRWSSDFALNYYKYALSVGIKLFSLKLLISIGQGIIVRWAEVLNDGNFSDIFALIGIILIFYKIVDIVPSVMQSLVQGGFSSGGHSSNGMTTAGLLGTAAGTAAGAVTGAAGATMATKQAFQLAQAQTIEDSALSKAGTPGKPMDQKLGGVLARTAKNLAAAGKEELTNTLSGKSPQGNIATRMAQNMEAKKESLMKQRETTLSSSNYIGNPSSKST